MAETRIELFWEPQSILKEIENRFGDSYAEMTSWQQAFLCGLIRRHRPNKIVEIGVSAGGTTAVLMNTLTMIGSDAHIYSVDYSETFYRDKSKKTGFAAEWAKRYQKDTLSVKWTHRLYAGGGICNYLDEIGKEIDFLILDTMHTCPGEILDFLACFPYLASDAVVVLHDIAMQFSNNSNAYATQLLLDTVCAKKTIGHDNSDKYYGYPNIGAFQITDETINHIEDVFSALNIPWQNIPQELQLYRNWYCTFYDKDKIEIYDIACLNNQDALRREEENCVVEIVRWINVANSIGQKSAYIYGNGKIGKRVHHVLTRLGIKILGHIVSEGEEKSDEAFYLDDIELGQDEIIVVGVGKTLTQTIKDNLLRKGISDYVSLF